jgi:hypothetical protein
MKFWSSVNAAKYLDFKQEKAQIWLNDRLNPPAKKFWSWVNVKYLDFKHRKMQVHPESMTD